MEMVRGEVGIDQGCRIVLVTGQLLDRQERNPPLDETGAEGMPEAVPDHPGEPGFFHGRNA